MTNPGDHHSVSWTLSNTLSSVLDDGDPGLSPHIQTQEDH
jgi:hypothetical protein